MNKIMTETNTKVTKARKPKSEVSAETKPKKALTAYILFVKSERTNVIRDHPDLKSKDVIREVASRWKNISPADKVKFETLAKQDAARYQTDMENSGLPTSSSKKREPKKPRNPYILFSSEVMPEFKRNHPDKKTTELAKLISEQWGQMTEEMKRKYVDASETDKQRYSDEKSSESTSVVTPVVVPTPPTPAPSTSRSKKSTSTPVPTPPAAATSRSVVKPAPPVETTPVVTTTTKKSKQAPPVVVKPAAPVATKKKQKQSKNLEEALDEMVN